MNNKFFKTSLILTIALIAILLFQSVAAESGSIFLSKSCDSSSGNEPHFNPLEWVYMQGTGFTPDTPIIVTVTGKTQSCDPHIEVLNIERNTGSGDFCIPVYKVRWGDFGSYDIEANSKSKIFHVDTNTYSPDLELCCEDNDDDGVCDTMDNCIGTYNPSQIDVDADGIGDECDPDDDNDGVCDPGMSDQSCTGSDNCQYIYNPDQIDSDSDGLGDACDDYFPEICDNKDNDADDLIDEDVYMQYGATDVGECAYGEKKCEYGGWITLTQSIEPTTETCDNLDNDCDGQIDNGYDVGEACTSASNSCGDTSTGVFVCSADSQGTECDAVTPLERAEWNQVCYSEANSCGDTNSGFINCDGQCIAEAPAERENYGLTCYSEENSCGDMNEGVFVCSEQGVVCNAEIPLERSEWNQICYSAVANSCGDVSEGLTGCDGVCSAELPAERENWNQVCYSDANSCGDVNEGLTDCDGICSAIVPAERELWNVACTSVANSCGDISEGFIGCDGLCTAEAPAERENYGLTCYSEENSCGDMNEGVFVCSEQGVVCNAETPLERAGWNQACTSEANACGQTNTGSINCGGVCTALIPANPDQDGDGVYDCNDNCVAVDNPDQADFNNNGLGDACDPDKCGNGLLDEGEECDGTVFEEISCSSYDYNSGSLSCTETCTIDSSACYNEQTNSDDSNSNNNGGSSSGGVSICLPSWVCSEWSDCKPDGTQTRTCYDKWDCNKNSGMPEIEQSCSYVKTTESSGNVLASNEEVPPQEESTGDEGTDDQSNDDVQPVITGATIGGILGKASPLWLALLLAIIAGLLLFVIAKRRKQAQEA